LCAVLAGDVVSPMPAVAEMTIKRAITERGRRSDWGYTKQKNCYRLKIIKFRNNVDLYPTSQSIKFI
jgi:hypothetical protein